MHFVTPVFSGRTTLCSFGDFGLAPALNPTVDRPMRLDTRGLDGLRALAALHVMMSHFMNFGGYNVDLMGGGSIGLFYILSGHGSTRSGAQGAGIFIIS